MAIVQVSDFGTKDGIRICRVHGDKKDLQKIIDELKKEAAIFLIPPEIENVGRGMWTLLLKLEVVQKVSEVG